MKTLNLKSLLIELILDKNKTGVEAISLVEFPAILTNFIKLAKETGSPSIKLAVSDSEQRIVLGPALIPNLKIFRSAKSMGLSQDAFVYFSADTIKELSQLYLATLKNNEVTIDHEKDTPDVKMIESWVIEDPAKDKSSIYGFDLPKGTWMVAFKVFNDSLWEDIKNDKLCGFSIEASSMALIPKGEVNMSAEEPEDTDPREVLPEEMRNPLLSHFKKNGTSHSSMESEGWTLLYEDDDLESDIFDEILLLTFAIESNPEEDSVLDKGKYAIRYKYSGPRDDKNREFCAAMLDADLLYRKEDVQNITFDSYHADNIFQYKGGKYCRHRFTRVVFVKKDSVSSNDIIPSYKKLPGESFLPDNVIPNDTRAINVNPDPK